MSSDRTFISEGVASLMALFVATFIAGGLAAGMWLSNATPPAFSLESYCNGAVDFGIYMDALSGDPKAISAACLVEELAGRPIFPTGLGASN